MKSTPNILCSLNPTDTANAVIALEAWCNDGGIVPGGFNAFAIVNGVQAYVYSYGPGSNPCSNVEYSWAQQAWELSFYTEGTQFKKRGVRFADTGVFSDYRQFPCGETRIHQPRAGSLSFRPYTTHNRRIGSCLVAHVSTSKTAIISGCQGLCAVSEA
ncbi:hypothetical protein MVEN_01588100 [Mycena venus]|uniref:Uncharacterized protein n=1 Tax=Mycena venus TaxID=2733690 RepID=A0A8H6XQL7_9AGAR|nr:hypothetical protein MVEN_01588100 [Mycena venus]